MELKKVLQRFTTILSFISVASTVLAEGSEEVSTEAEEFVNQTWVIEAVKDVAFYLRAHKFQDFDRRYHLEEESAPKESNLYSKFPTPPLRTLHWEIRQNCEKSFYDCLKYLQEKAQMAELRRQDDTNTVMADQGWTLETNGEQIAEVDAQCRKLRERDWRLAQPFQGPLERFQWRASASLIMCVHTLWGRPELSILGERCDNAASCLDPDHEADPRADDRLPFHCALYSFCPDLCCPLRHYTTMQQCWDDERHNPCYEEAPSSQRQCGLEQGANLDIAHVANNRLNLTCVCKKPGYRWMSKWGMCVDIDECLEKTHYCDSKTEACLNQQGSYKCICAWGYLLDSRTGHCERNYLLKPPEERKVVETKISPLQWTLKVLFPNSYKEAYFYNSGGSALTKKLLIHLTSWLPLFIHV